MKKEIRTQKIRSIVEAGNKDQSRHAIEIPWEGGLAKMTVHKIPLDYLVYNKYNGRILSRTQSLEKQGREIDVTSDAGRQKLEELLWASRENANKYTKDKIKQYGQLKPGIITKDGIIVDGNRRAMLLEKLRRENPGDKFRYFKAAVLPVTLDNSPLEIEKLETKHQMGEDEKLGYNPIEKYLKAYRLHRQNLPEAEIAELMGVDPLEVKDYLKIKKRMDEYLEYLGYDGIYTQLDDREDQFIILTKWLETFYGERSTKAFDGYTDFDVDDLKQIAFDCIRTKFEGKRFRIIARGQRGSHFFGDKDIWSQFRNAHNDHMDPIREKADKDQIDFGSKNIKAHLDERDEKYGEREFLNDNVETYEEKLRSNQARNEPKKLLRTTRTNLDALSLEVKQNPQAFHISELEEVYDTVTEIIKGKTPPDQLLTKAAHLLKAVKIEGEDALDKDLLRDKLDEINRISSNIKRELGY